MIETLEYALKCGFLLMLLAGEILVPTFFAIIIYYAYKDFKK